MRASASQSSDLGNPATDPSRSLKKKKKKKLTGSRTHATVLGRSFLEPEEPEEVLEVEVSVELIEDQEQTPVELINDLKAAVEVISSKGRSVLYPGKSMKLDAMPVEVSLRDDPSIHGICKEFDGTQLFLSSGAFGNFGAEVQHFIEQENVSIQREERLQEQRIRELLKKVKWAAVGPFFRLNSCLWGAVLVFLVICLVVRLESYAVAVVLCLGAGCLCCCTGQISVASSVFFAPKSRGAREVAKDLTGQKFDLDPSRLEWFLFLFPLCLSVVAFVCLVVMTVMYGIEGFPWAAASLWPPVLLLLAFFIAFFRSEKFKNAYLAVHDRIFGDPDKLQKEGGLNFRDHTIVFEGKILPGKPCVSSWPGKYESAWDALVKKSRRGNLSAAVVFLPKGSRHFGIHDKIPPAEKLPGACWCTPLYGEQKPWGCRWWTHWIKNIEEAVEKGAELEVYFFHNMKGKGKVENFSRAGAEHLRREQIWGRQKRFKKSQEFKSAVSAGLKELSKKNRGDGSSQYSREEHRLFLSWLEEEDREFLVSSEGLGNSQKAEVAWLQRKGYAYTEVEVDISKWVESDWKSDVASPAKSKHSEGAHTEVEVDMSKWVESDLQSASVSPAKSKHSEGAHTEVEVDMSKRVESDLQSAIVSPAKSKHSEGAHMEVEVDMSKRVESDLQSAIVSPTTYLE